MFNIPVRRSGDEVLHWLIRHRWLAVVGQSAAILTAVSAFGLRFQPFALAAGVMLLALSNHRLLPEFGAEGGRISRILAMDVALLTWMLYWTGGIANPFVVCYLLNVALAAMLLERHGVLWIGLLSAAGLVLVSLFHEPFFAVSDWATNGRLAPALYAVGSVVALVLVGTIMAVFVFAMRRQLMADERRLRDGARRMAELERFKSLATLAAGVAHELGTPLGTIAVVAKDLERGLGSQNPQPELAEDAALIRSELERCRTILKRLDQRTTGGTGSSRERIRLGEIGPRLIGRLSPAQAERLRIECDAPRDEICLPAEPLLQSLVVLVENACDADVAGHAVTLAIGREGGDVWFRVSDRGSGITDEARRRAGEPYFTTKGEAGSGLGLFLVRTLTMELDGEVSLEPLAAGGTCATLKLPMVPHGDESDDTNPGDR